MLVYVNSTHKFMRQVFASGVLCLLLLGLLGPHVSRAGNVDLSISPNAVRFSETVLYANEVVRIYATIRNVGEVDSIAQVFFYQGDRLIGGSQPVSVLAGGDGDDVFVDFTLPDGSFNIRAVIQGSDPADENPANDVAITPLFKTISDDDRDGVLNADDNCPTQVNVDQIDFDHDGQGDICDNDMDNDGYRNSDDAYPQDASRSTVEIVPPPVVPPVATEPVTVAEPIIPSTVVNIPDPIVSPPPEVVLGVEDERIPAQAVALTEPSPDLTGLSSGAPVTPPSVRFALEQVNWHTYNFVAEPPLGMPSPAFTWDFGDGGTSVQPQVSHTFSSTGTYTVTLANVAPDGTVTSESQTVPISFFHLGNPFLLGALGALFLILIGLAVLIVRLRRGEEV